MVSPEQGKSQGQKTETRRIHQGLRQDIPREEQGKVERVSSGLLRKKTSGENEKGGLVETMWLLIGKDGQLGSALYKHFKDCIGTSRHTGAKPYFQLTDDPWRLPHAEVVFIVAAKTKFRDCEIDGDAWNINVDSPIRIAARFGESFIVYISSEAAEWSGHTAYGDQKRFAEMGLRAVVPYHRLAIIRPDKVSPDRIDDLCKLMEKIGREKIGGIYRFRK